MYLLKSMYYFYKKKYQQPQFEFIHKFLPEKQTIKEVLMTGT